MGGGREVRREGRERGRERGMLTRYVRGSKRVGKSCLFMTPTDTPRHKQVGKKYR